jgi:hypothetical protein
MTRMMMIPKTEYKVRLLRRDHLWQVTHLHSYPNWNTSHVVYTGVSWEFCMWIATGDPFYLAKLDLKLLASGRSKCGMRALDGNAWTRTRT